MKTPRKTKIIEIRQAGPGHDVVTVVTSNGRDKSNYRRKPCGGCPWRVDTVGDFPAEAFKHSARTAYDMSTHVFSCHESGTEKGAICAGYLLRGADHSLAIRMEKFKGETFVDVEAGTVALHENYRAMAIANGVPPDDESLSHCRD